MTEMISKWFFASFRTPLLFYSTMRRSRDRRGVFKRFQDKISNRKISNRKISKAIYRKTKYRSRKISNAQNIDGAKYRNCKISNCKISNRKISKMQNIEMQDIEGAKYREAKYRKQNIEVAKYRKSCRFAYEWARASRKKTIVLLATRRSGWYINITLAGTGGLMQPAPGAPLGFSGISFLFTGRMSPIFL